MKSIVANWKMNGSRNLVKEFEVGLQDFEALNCEVIMCPPFVYLSDFTSVFKKSMIKIGAQNCSHIQKGALTGEVSCEMLRDLGCDYVIIAHSERRKLFEEQNEEIANKLTIAFANNLIPILCIGETAEERDANIIEKVLESQLEVMKAIVNSAPCGFKELMVAYEPVWAIGSGITPTLEQIDSTHKFIREKLDGYFNHDSLKIKILYGGSVNLSNASELFNLEAVDGGLIGGASLDVASFKELCAIANTKSL